MAHRIQNFEALATTPLRLDALAVAEAGYAAIDVGAAFERSVTLSGDTLTVLGTSYQIAGRQIYFVGVGKCAFAAALAAESVLGDSLTSGVALDVSLIEGRTPAKIETYIGTHPLPSETNERASKRILEFLRGRTESDLVLMLISGGGSTLLCAHDAPMTCTDESLLWSELTAHGATIQEINTVRKHTSRLRGGGLAAAAQPAEVIALVVSDVPGNDLATIASSPTVLDTSTVADAEAVLAHYGINAGNALFSETPKDPAIFSRATTRLMLSNDDALAAMEREASSRGYAVTVEGDHLTGEAREVGHDLVEALRRAPAKSALLYAGETTVTLAGVHGDGGRNQELALAALNEVAGDELVLPFASDGRDNTDVAGAIADATTRAHAFAANAAIEEHLAAHRSFDFFKTTGDALTTGYTGSNISDLIITLKT